MNGAACTSGPDPCQPGSELAVPFSGSNPGVLAAARAGSTGQRLRDGAGAPVHFQSNSSELGFAYAGAAWKTEYCLPRKI